MFEYQPQESKRFCFQNLLNKDNFDQKHTKVWKMFDVCKNEIEGFWVKCECVCEGGFAPSETISQITHISSILFLHMSGIFHTFV